MQSTISRRHVIATAAALPVAAMPAVAEASADAELIDLRKQLEQGATIDRELHRSYLSTEAAAGERPHPDDFRDTKAWWGGYCRWYVESGLDAICTEQNDLIDHVVSPIMDRIRERDTASIGGVAAVAMIVFFQNPDLWFDDEGATISPEDIDDWGERQVRRLVDDVLALAEKVEATSCSPSFAR